MDAGCAYVRARMRVCTGVCARCACVRARVCVCTRMHVRMLRTPAPLSSVGYGLMLTGKRKVHVMFFPNLSVALEQIHKSYKQN